MQKKEAVDILNKAYERVTFEKSNYNYIVHKIRYDADVNRLLHAYYVELRNPEKGLDFDPYIIFGESNYDKEEALKSLINNIDGKG